MTATATRIIPAEHDAAQFALVQRLYAVEDKVTALRLRMHHMAGDKETGRGRNRSWGMGFAEVSLRMAVLRDAGDAILSGYSTRPSQVLAQDAALLDEMRELDAQAEAMEKTWRQHRWTRWYPCLNADGHIHRSLNGCPTVNRGMSRTQMGWETSLSGKTVAEAIAELGPRLCSVCFPGAPAEHCRSLRDITRGEREAEKARKDAEKLQAAQERAARAAEREARAALPRKETAADRRSAAMRALTSKYPDSGSLDGAGREQVASEIEALAGLGRSAGWKDAIGSWAAAVRDEESPVLWAFAQYSIGAAQSI